MRSLTLIVAAASAYALLRGWPGAPDLVPRACLAVAILLVGVAFWGGRRDTVTPRMWSLRRAKVMDYLTLAAAIVFTEASLVVITSTLAAPVDALVVAFESPFASVRQSGGVGRRDRDRSAGVRVSGLWDFRKDLKVDIRSNDDPKLSNQPEVFMKIVESEDANTLLNSRIYLRSLALSRFNGITWSASPTPRSERKAPITFPRYNPESSINYRVYHANNPTGNNLFISLHGVTATGVTQLTHLGDAIHRLPELIDDTDGYSYDVTSSPLHWADLMGKPIAPAAPARDDLSLPSDLAHQLRLTAQAFSREPDLAARLDGLRHFLQDHYVYSLKTTNRSDASPLENFLYQEKRGYCEHFATAAAMLCRALGVPSRIAFGWSGGRLYKAQNMFVFRAKDAHAWTEIHLEGYGWVVFDTTPADGGATPEAHAAPEGEEAPDPEEAITQQQSADDPFPSNPLALKMASRTLYLMLVIVGICGAAALMIRARTRPMTTPEGRSVLCRPPTYLIEFKQTCAILGYPMPSGRTLRQHLDVLRNNDAAPAFVDGMLGYHYGVVYNAEPKNPSTEKALKHGIREWKKSTLVKAGHTQEPS
ncbi:MAG: DUF3488 and transglutaminase-like domain-containing protein [Verrucomicrobiae bacterium]|nr:DUF3488 and transglutaminase-like domain-containing protein [Verrucomicrobiae bacterium]NNJ42932.1 transglutaminase domain-containing protein [Akkermansiaceae bacterium]